MMMTIAFWCVLIAAFLPYVAFGLVKGLDPKLPRESAKQLEGVSLRAHGAHLNHFEAFAPFAAAVIIAHIVEGPSALANWLAAAFIVVRLGYTYMYVTDRQPLRSACFGIGGFIIVAIFIQAALH
jgi:uncharacterized MAPEG superfamily protein